MVTSFRGGVAAWLDQVLRLNGLRDRIVVVAILQIAGLNLVNAAHFPWRDRRGVQSA